MTSGAKVVLVTGATGFVGSSVVPRLGRAGWQVRSAGYRGAGPASFRVPLDSGSDWSAALAGASAVVHLAARAHVLNERSSDPLAEFRRVNVAATVGLAKRAAERGIRRFIFVSTIGVHGFRADVPVAEADTPSPASAYAISKYEAELALQQIAAETGMELVVLRPPLVYGPRVRGRFLHLLQVVRQGWPLPFAAVDNLRSFIGVQNLADAVLLSLDHPRAAGRTYIVADDKPVSTPDLLRRIGSSVGRPAVLWPAPVGALRTVARAVGKLDDMDRLVRSLVADTSAIRRELGWSPPLSLEQELRATAGWLLGGAGA